MYSHYPGVYQLLCIGILLRGKSTSTIRHFQTHPKSIKLVIYPITYPLNTHQKSSNQHASIAS